MSRRVIFIAGPFRAENAWEIEQNIRRAEETALALWRLGAAVICPHTNTRFFQGAAPDATWLEGDREILRRCDGLVLLEGWPNSDGAKAELEVAATVGMPTFRWPTDQEAIRRWVWEGI